jgi:hypothetical protein
MLTGDQLAKLVQDFYDHVLAQENLVRLKVGIMPETVRRQRAGRFRQMAHRARGDLASNDFRHVAFITRQDLLRHGLTDMGKCAD